MEIYGKRISHFFFFAAAAARAVTACAAAGAFRAVGTADALDAAFFRFTDISCRKSNDGGDEDDDGTVTLPWVDV